VFAAVFVIKRGIGSTKARGKLEQQFRRCSARVA
jgi:hypothetical protein